MTRNFTDSELEDLRDSILSTAVEQEPGSTGAAAIAAMLDATLDKRLRAILDATVGKLNEALRPHRPMRIVVNDLPEVDIGTVSHPVLPDVVAELKAGHHVLLTGPAGSGKSFLAAQAARVLGIPFHGYVSCTNGTSESAFLGQLLPNEEGGFSYYPAPPVDAAKSGGVVCIDEIDAGDPNTLMVLNAALNGDPLFIPKRFSNPIQPIHENTRFVCTANTFCLGSDRVYAGRNQLDGATLDRMVGIEVGYDRNLEGLFCPDKDLREKLWSIRTKIEEQRLRRFITGRTLRRAYTWRHACGYDDAKIISRVVLGWSKDEKKAIGVS